MKLIIFTRQDNIEVKFKTSLKDVENLDENFVINNIKLNTFLEQNLFYCFDKKQWTLNEMLFFAKNNLMLVRIYDETESTLLKTYDETNPIPYPTTTTTTTAAVTKIIKYGRLYNWFAITDPRGVAPVGWHVPTDDEWIALIDYLGGRSVAGGKIRTTDEFYWPSPNEATNESGFSAVGAGVLQTTFRDKNVNTFYGSSTSLSEIGCGSMFLNGTSTGFYAGGYHKSVGQAIRLIKDNGVNEGPVTIDGDLYTTVTIGTQVWLQQNLAVTHYQNGDLIGSDFTGTSGAVTAYDNDELNVYI